MHRDRITIDLRGHGTRLQASAAAQGLSVAAFARRILIAHGVGVPPPPGSQAEAIPAPSAHDETRIVKVTLRLPDVHAAILSMQARRADVSQSAYIAGLIEGAGLSRARHSAQDSVTLARSTDQLALIARDLGAFQRLLRQANHAQLEPYRERMRSLADDVRVHLQLAGTYLAGVQQARPHRPHRPNRPHRGRPRPPQAMP